MSTPRPRSPLAVLLAVGFSVFVAADDLTVVSTMLRPMIVDVGLVLPDGLNDAAWIVNAYLIAFVAVMPLAGRLSDAVGRRSAFLLAYSVFLVGTIVVPVSVSMPNAFGWLLVGRVLTALGGGAMVPVALASVADVYGVGPRSRALGALGAIETLGWVWGPLYGAMLVRYLDWRWQFWFNIPLTLVGMALCWWALADIDRPRRQRIDWVGATLLTTALVSLSVALLNGAEIQSVSGLDELTGQRRSTVWLYPVALVAALAFWWWERRQRTPLIDISLLRGRNVVVALIVNLIVGAGLVVAMVDVPLFVNAVEIDVQRAAVLSGWILSALTAAMAIASYVGGRITERTSYRPATLAGASIATVALLWMWATWSGSTSFGLFAVQLALLGAGFGLTVAPTSSAVVDAAPADDRGTAAGLVMLFRLLGLCLGLSALTAWALRRFDELRSTIELPPLGSDGFEEAVLTAQRTLTAAAITDTFAVAAGVVGIGAIAAFAMGQRHLATQVEQPPHHSSRMKGSAMEQAASSPAPDQGVPTQPRPAPTGDDLPAAMDALRRRMNLLVGALGLLLLGAVAMILILVGRVNQATADAATARAEVEQVAGGAALYTSQIQGFQEQLAELEPEVSQQVDDAIAGLREFGDSTLTFPVEVDETVPIDTNITIERTVEIPIDLDVPIKQTFDTTIEVDSPFGPIPLDVSVPVDVTVPIKETATIPINETIPITQDVPLNLSIPVEVDVAETELSTLTESIADGLETFSDLLGGLSAQPPESAQQPESP